MRLYHNNKAESSKISGDRGAILFQLEKLCEIFGLSIDESFDEQDPQTIIGRISQHVEDVMKSSCLDSLFDGQKTILSKDMDCDPDQSAIFHTMQEAIYQV